MPSLPLPETGPPPITRRVFVGAVAALGATALSGTALAGAATAAPAGQKIERATGVARHRGVVRTLGRAGADWFLLGADGSTRPTRGLEHAEVADLTATGTTLVAVGARDVPTVWESTDGSSWQEAVRLTGVDGHLTAVGAHGGAVLAAGALLTLERAPRRRIVLLRTGSGWETVTTSGLAHTDEQAATAVTGGPGGWLLSTVDADGSLLATSPDGRGWTPHAVEPRLVDAAVRSLAVAGDRVHWMANAMSGAVGVLGTLGAGRRLAPTPEGATAVGMLDGRGYWLVDGALVEVAA